MVQVCLTAGLLPALILCLERRRPTNDEEVATVAADYVIFMHRSRAAAAARLTRFVHAMKEHNVVPNLDNNVDEADAIEALGCTLSNFPGRTEPEVGKLFIHHLLICHHAPDFAPPHSAHK